MQTIVNDRTSDATPEPKRKFKQIWKNQSEIGRMFGQSAIEIGKILLSVGLRERSPRRPTAYALTEEYAIETPLRDGTQHFLWNIDKVEPIIREYLQSQGVTIPDDTTIDRSTEKRQDKVPGLW